MNISFCGNSFEKKKILMSKVLLLLLLILSLTLTISATPTNWGYCGDGVIAGSEQCDQGASNGAAGSCCNNDCTLVLSGVSCRAPNGDCDFEEFCDGVVGSCPSDEVMAEGTQCYTNTGSLPCYADQYCTGYNTACPSPYLAAGVECSSSGDMCVVEYCDGAGTCELQRTISYDDSNYCNGVETCDSATGYVIPGTPPDCDDGNSCTIDSCDNTWEICVHTPMDGTFGPCADSDDEHYDDVYQWGHYICDGTGDIANITCVGAIIAAEAEICGNGIDDDRDGHIDNGCGVELSQCVVDSDCSFIPTGQCTVAICDTVTSTCRLAYWAEYHPCDDGLPCTINDKCDEGLCRGTNVTCDDGNECTHDYCDDTLGLCVYDPVVMFHAPCTSPNLCSFNDACDNQGYCVPGDTMLCYSLDECNDNQCDPLVGDCASTAITGWCATGDPCTNFDQCYDGTCEGAAVYVDVPLCMTESCDIHGTITSSLLANTCYIDHVCYANGDQNPSDPCRFCNSTKTPYDWSWPDVGSSAIACDDGFYCTDNDTCDFAKKQCRGTQIDCSYINDQCQTGVCGEIEGGCYSSFHNGQSCNDHNACTSGEQCSGDSCGGGSPVDCTYLITDAQCQYVTCDSVSGCSLHNYENDQPCTLDNNICSTGVPTCQAGVCTASATPVCNEAHGQCSYWVCDDPVHGCTQHFNGSSTHCNPTSACYTDGLCVDNTDICDEITPINCDDSNVCTNDFCDYVTGCYNVLVSSDCVNCNRDTDCPDVACTTHTCVAHQCQYVNSPSGTSCADTTVCNGDEICDGSGTCLGAAPLNCNDHNSCTDDTCNALTGCVHTNNNANTCDDGLYCTINDHCSSGSCVSSPYTACSSSDTACVSYTCSEDLSGGHICTPHHHVAASCNDADACTINDQCDVNGGCAGTPMTCPAGDGVCIASYTCVGGACEPNYVTDGTACTGSNLCFDGTCQSGVCTYFQPSISNWPGGVVYNLTTETVTCLAEDQCKQDTQCDPATGYCTTSPKTDNTPCDDSDACSQIDVCLYGMCTGTDYVICYPLDQCHDAGVCNAGTGVCTNPAKPNYTPCDDGSVCTTADACIGGVCEGFSPLDCSVSNPCLSGACDVDTGCYTTYNDGAPCDDANECTTGTTCVSGLCPSNTGSHVTCPAPINCSAVTCLPVGGCIDSPVDQCEQCATASDCPNIPCMRAICQANLTCTYVVDNSNIVGCLDSHYCNGIEVCDAGVCYAGTPPSCDDYNECTTDTCDTDLNSCTHVPRTGSSCTSSNLCVLVAECSSGGACNPVTSVSCDPAATCHVSMGCNPSNGICEYHTQTDGTACNDGNACTLDDECNSGSCIGTNHVTCTPLDQCHLVGTCDTSTGTCSNPQQPTGTHCNDYNVCTIGDHCSTVGTCVGIAGHTCDTVPHDTQCQTLSCDSLTSQCVVDNLSDGTYCNTGNAVGACSAQDVCISGACTDQYQSGTSCRAPQNDCDAEEYCSGMDDTCPPNVYQPDETACSTDLYCTYNWCISGICTQYDTRTCTDGGNSCVVPSCDENINSCVVTPISDGTSCTTGIDLFPCIAWEECVAGTCSPHYATPSVGCDGDLCTFNNHCAGNANVCINGPPKDCSAYGDVCNTGLCDELTGSCYASPINDGIMCNADNNPCTVNDTCVSGTCTAGHPRDCSYLDNDCGFGYCNATLNADDGECVYEFIDPNCNPDHCSGGCTYTVAHWQAYNPYAPNPAYRIPWNSNFETWTMCGKTTYQWIMLRAKGNAWRKLAQGTFTAMLNVMTNGACMTTDINNIINSGINVLLDCQTDLSVYSKSAGIYKTLTVKLDGYNGGLYGPGNCVDESCASQATSQDPDPCLTTTTSFYTRSKSSGASNEQLKLHTFEWYQAVHDGLPPPPEDNTAVISDGQLQRSIGRGTGFVRELSQESDCEHGKWNFELNECVCHYGWAGVDCDTCASPQDASKIFLCVPTRLDAYPYILRQIPQEKIAQYMGTSAGTLPFVSVPNRPAIYPGTDGLDCFCQAITQSGPVASRQMVRDLAFTVTDNQDLFLYIDIIESDLGVCEITWEGNNTLPVPTYIEISVENDDVKPYKIAVIVFASVIGFAILMVVVVGIYRAASSEGKPKFFKSKHSSSSSHKKARKGETMVKHEKSPWSSSVSLRHAKSHI